MQMNTSRKVAIIGLGYVGLPLAVHLAERGHTVLGLDKDTRKIESIIKGESYIPDVSSKELQSLLTKKKLIVNTPDRVLLSFKIVIMLLSLSRLQLMNKENQI